MLTWNSLRSRCCAKCFTCKILTTTLPSRFCYYHHFMDEATEALRHLSISELFHTLGPWRHHKESSFEKEFGWIPPQVIDTGQMQLSCEKPAEAWLLVSVPVLVQQKQLWDQGTHCLATQLQPEWDGPITGAAAWGKPTWILGTHC